MRSPIDSALCSPQKPIPSTCWTGHCSEARTKPSPASAITADRPSDNHDKPELQLEYLFLSAGHRRSAGAYLAQTSAVVRFPLALVGCDHRGAGPIVSSS